MLISTNRADHLASSDILNALLISYRRPLNLFDNAMLTDAVSAEEDSWHISDDSLLRVVLLVL